ncbi:MAG: hypothetical protein A3F09_03710 [Chlamydiae bacterium RIFCSPHIGHO2_12_FULL_49_11]|nr:MAG: hypothetical protein A3F09_03710 [Chlamydiae bacterium RIFCSPHIGHO2_12_FULL_49_11]
MKKNLLSGLILLLPVAITIYVFSFLINFLTTPFLPHVEKLLGTVLAGNNLNPVQYHTLIVVVSRTVILLFLFFGVIVLGFLGQKIFFAWIVRTFHSIMLRIPFIKGVYKMVSDIISAVFSHKKKLISRIVIVPFPSELSRTIGLVTGNAPHQLQSSHEHPENVLKSVFVPTSPHPISGLLLLAEERYLKKVDLTTEEAFKYLLSCGISIPSKEEKASENGLDYPVSP